MTAQTTSTPRSSSESCNAMGGEKVHGFKVGDAVTLTNDYGAVFTGKTVIGTEVWEGYTDTRYFISPTDTPWFSHEAGALKHADLQAVGDGAAHQ